MAEWSGGSSGGWVGDCVEVVVVVRGDEDGLRGHDGGGEGGRGHPVAVLGVYLEVNSISSGHLLTSVMHNHLAVQHQTRP